MTETEALHAAQERAHAKAMSVLPEEFCEVADVIGIQRTWDLILLARGTRNPGVLLLLPRGKRPSERGMPKQSTRARDNRVELYVPKVQRLRENHPLAVFLGWDVAQALCREFGGRRLRLGSGGGGEIERRERLKRNDRIREMAAKGLPNSYIAKACGVTSQTVRNVIARSGG